MGKLAKRVWEVMGEVGKKTQEAQTGRGGEFVGAPTMVSAPIELPGRLQAGCCVQSRDQLMFT